MSDFEAQFLTNNYKIQINISYDSNETDDAKNNYYIIDNMKDILLEEFSNKEKYELFKHTYSRAIEASEFPLYIINDPFYIDKRVLDSIRKTTTSNFPTYKGSARSQIEYLKNNKELFLRNSSNDEKKSLLAFIKEVFLLHMKDSRPNSNYTTIENTNTLDGLFSNSYFINSDNGLGGSSIHDVIKQKYYAIAERTNPLKKVIEKFYNITNNNLNTKYKYEYFLNIENIRNIYKFINQNSAEEQRSPLNNNQTKDDIYNKYLKYVFPNKKDTSNLSDPDKDKILMFYNVFYIIKNEAAFH